MQSIVGASSNECNALTIYTLDDIVEASLSEFLQYCSFDAVTQYYNSLSLTMVLP